MNIPSGTPASPTALAAIAFMSPACHGCEVLRMGKCGVFNAAAGDVATRDEALAVLAQTTPVNQNQQACGDPVPPGR